MKKKSFCLLFSVMWSLDIISSYLTNSLQSVDRFPISFRSIFRGNVYRHIVLGLHISGRYGAVGLSRRDDLMYKPLKYTVSSHLTLDMMFFCCCKTITAISCTCLNWYWVEVMDILIISGELWKKQSKQELHLLLFWW